MEFSPDDVAGREFLSAVGGFDREEVRQFLDAVAAQIRDKNRQIKELNDKVSALEEELSQRPAAPAVDVTLLTDLQNQSRELVRELHSTTDEMSALVSELRDAQQVVVESSERAAIARKTESSESTQAGVEPSDPSASVDSAGPPAGAEQPSAATPAEWEALLSDPE